MADERVTFNITSDYTPLPQRVSDDPRDAGYTNANPLPNRVPGATLQNPYLPALEALLNEVDAEDAAEALINAYNPKGLNKLMWALCSYTGQPAAMSLIDGSEQFVITKPQED